MPLLVRGTVKARLILSPAPSVTLPRGSPNSCGGFFGVGLERAGVALGVQRSQFVFAAVCTLTCLVGRHCGATDGYLGRDTPSIDPG